VARESGTSSSSSSNMSVTIFALLDIAIADGWDGELDQACEYCVAETIEHQRIPGLGLYYTA
jgi:hypothetical protein